MSRVTANFHLLTTLPRLKDLFDSTVRILQDRRILGVEDVQFKDFGICTEFNGKEKAGYFVSLYTLNAHAKETVSRRLTKHFEGKGLTLEFMSGGTDGNFEMLFVP